MEVQGEAGRGWRELSALKSGNVEVGAVVEEGVQDTKSKGFVNYLQLLYREVKVNSLNFRKVPVDFLVLWNSLII